MTDGRSTDIIKVKKEGMNMTMQSMPMAVSASISAAISLRLRVFRCRKHCSAHSPGMVILPRIDMQKIDLLIDESCLSPICKSDSIRQCLRNGKRRYWIGLCRESGKRKEVLQDNETRETMKLYHGFHLPPLLW